MAEMHHLKMAPVDPVKLHKQHHGKCVLVRRVEWLESNYERQRKEKICRDKKSK